MVAQWIWCFCVVGMVVTSSFWQSLFLCFSLFLLIYLLLHFMFLFVTQMLLFLFLSFQRLRMWRHWIWGWRISRHLHHHCYYFFLYILLYSNLRKLHSPPLVKVKKIALQSFFFFFFLSFKFPKLFPFMTWLLSIWLQTWLNYCLHFFFFFLLIAHNEYSKILKYMTLS